MKNNILHARMRTQRFSNIVRGLRYREMLNYSIISVLPHGKT
jgi:hypothetical protein